MGNTVLGGRSARAALAIGLIGLVACSGELSGQGDQSFGGTGGSERPAPGMGGALGGGGAGGNGFPMPPGGGGQGGDPVGTAGSGGAVPGGTGGVGGFEPVDPPAGSVPMFIAQGHGGRTIISCDDGRTWVADQSERAWSYCRTNDCDHDSGAGRGITWGDGWFFATFGWGSPGSVRRSRDGVEWETIDAGKTFGGVIYGRDRLVLASRAGLYSDDHGGSWNDFGQVELTLWNVRDAGFADYDGGRFIMVADDGPQEIVVSRDGVDWSQPSSIPSSCSAGSYQGSVVYGNGTILLVGSSGTVCRSTDGGDTWSAISVASSLSSNGVWTGSEFLVWDGGSVYRSPDGASWTGSAISPNGVDIGVAAVSNRGTLVAITNGWRQDYDDQAFYRSEDGVNWEVLPASAYTGGHPINVVTFGFGAPSEYCAP